MTLIDKLNEHKETIAVLRDAEKKAVVGFTFISYYLLGLQAAIDIIKEHNEWISVDECLPPDEIKLLFEHEDYGIIIGYYREKGEFVTYDTHYNYREPIGKFSKWCYIPPRGV